MIASEYIWRALASNNETKAAEIYIAEMEDEGVRTCNDGFPDARSPLTNPYKIRIRIAALRQRHSSMINKMHVVRVCCCKYNAVSPEVAKSNIDKIRDMFGWSK